MGDVTKRDLTRLLCKQLPLGEYVDEALYRFAYCERAIKHLRSTEYGCGRVCLFRIRCWDLGGRHQWEIGFPTLLQALGDEFHYDLWYWTYCESEYTEAFIAELLARLQDEATYQTAAGILTLVGFLLLRLTSCLATFDRLVERLTRRVLAPGGKTALYIPLT